MHRSNVFAEGQLVRTELHRRTGSNLNRHICGLDTNQFAYPSEHRLALASEFHFTLRSPCRCASRITVICDIVSPVVDKHAAVRRVLIPCRLSKIEHFRLRDLVLMGGLPDRGRSHKHPVSACFFCHRLSVCFFTPMRYSICL